MTKKCRPVLPRTGYLRASLIERERTEKGAAKKQGEKGFVFDRYITIDGKPVTSVRTAWRTMVKRTGFQPDDNVTPYSIRTHNGP